MDLFFFFASVLVPIPIPPRAELCHGEKHTVHGEAQEGRGADDQDLGRCSAVGPQVFTGWSVGERSWLI